MKKYEFNKSELTEKAFAVYSDSSFTFWKDAAGTFYRSDNPNSEKVEVGTIEDVNDFFWKCSHDKNKPFGIHQGAFIMLFCGGF